MHKHFLLLFCGAMLLAQARTPEEPNAAGTESTAAKFLKLTLDMLEKANRQNFLLLVESVKVLRNSMDQLKKLPDRSLIMNSYIAELTVFDNRIMQTLKQENELAGALVSGFLDLIERFDNVPAADLNPDRLKVNETLQKNGLDAVKKTVYDQLPIFMGHFDQRFKIFAESLNENESEQLENILSWYQNFSTTEDTETKMLLLNDFFDLEILTE